ncbi:MAG: hypothetical protein LBP86_03820 [Azoarcus sp.]|jgi:hypothetical protein|nr:hypothetical protein [Azoarcus sp.]
MREEIVNPENYPPEILAKIQTARNLTISIANRWMLGWPERVQSLMDSGDYWTALVRQTETEADAQAELIDQAERLNLAPWEVNDLAGLDPAPPVPR